MMEDKETTEGDQPAGDNLGELAACHCSLLCPGL